MATRRERVVLELEDNFTTPMARAAASTALLKRELNDLSGQSVKSGRVTAAASKDVDKLGTSSRTADSSINQLTGRLRVLADVAAILGPTLAPLGVTAAAGIAGLANQLGVAVLAGGSAVVAFQGVGDALKAVNEAALEPTQDNLAEARRQMEQLAPAARAAVRAMQDLRPTLTGIRDAGAQGLFPGFIKGLEALETRAPEIERIVFTLNRAMGRLMKQGGKSLAGDDWDDFFDFLATDARDTLVDLGHTVGNLGRGLAELWMAFDPLSDDFSGWARGQAEDFAQWADALAQTEGFAEFVAYVRESGPQVASALSAMGGAILQIAEAAAPIGGPVLAGLEAVSKVIGAIADSDLGTPIMAGVTALALYNRTLAVTASLQARAAAGGGLLGMVGGSAGGKGLGASRAALTAARADVAALGATWATAGARTVREQERMAASARSLRTNLGGVAKGAAPTAAALAGLAVASTGAADGMGVTNTASLALMGTMAGPWGAAIGGAVGLLLDVKSGSDNLKAATIALNAAIEAGDYEGMANGIKAVREQLDDLDSVEGASGKLNALGAALGPLGMLGSAGVGAYDAAEAGLGKLLGTTDQAREALAAAAEAEREAARAANAPLEAWRRQNETLQRNIDLMRAKRDEALAGSNAETSYASALLDARDAIKDNGRTLDLSTRKGIANQSALDAMAGAWNHLTETTNQTPAAFRRARKALVDTAVQMGMSRREAREYADQMMAIPEKVLTKVGVQSEDALERVRVLRLAMAQIKDKTVTVRVNSVGGVSPGNTGLGPQDKSADGGTVPKTGKPYADRHPYLLADGEEVISNRHGQADRHRGLLKAINAGRLADGGTVGGGGWGVVAVGGGKGASSALERLRKAAEKASDGLDKETKKRDRLQSAFDGLVESVRSGYRSEIFGQERKPWLPGPASPVGTIDADLANLRALNQARKVLASKGLDGGALDELISKGDLSEVQAMAGMSKGQLAAYERKYEQRERLLNQVGRGAADSAYGADLRESRKEVREQTAHLKKIEKRLAQIEKHSKDAPGKTGKAVASGVNSGAQKGRRAAR